MKVSKALSSKSQMSILTIPKDIAKYINSFLEFRDLLSIRWTCKHFFKETSEVERVRGKVKITAKNCQRILAFMFKDLYHIEGLVITKLDAGLPGRLLEVEAILNMQGHRERFKDRLSVPAFIDKYMIKNSPFLTGRPYRISLDVYFPRVDDDHGERVRGILSITITPDVLSSSLHFHDHKWESKLVRDVKEINFEDEDLGNNNIFFPLGGKCLHVTPNYQKILKTFPNVKKIVVNGISPLDETPGKERMLNMEKMMKIQEYAEHRLFKESWWGESIGIIGSHGDTGCRDPPGHITVTVSGTPTRASLATSDDRSNDKRSNSNNTIAILRRETRNNRRSKKSEFKNRRR